MSEEMPTNSELAQKIVGAVNAVQHAQADMVASARMLTEHLTDPEAHINRIYEETGQLGGPVKMYAVDANELTATGFYYVNAITENSVERHWPVACSLTTPVRVLNKEGVIYQMLEYPGCHLIRRSIDVGNTWTRWGIVQLGGQGFVYLSKSGNDDNFGLTPEYPVLTMNRAVEILNNFHATTSRNWFTLRVGAGDWGDVSFYSIPYLLYITPYDGSDPAEDSEDLPHFGTLYFECCNHITLRGIKIDYLNLDGSRCNIAGLYNRIKYFAASNKSVLFYNNTDNSICEVGQPGAGAAGVISVMNDSVFLSNKLNFKLIEDVSDVAFLYSIGGGKWINERNADMGFDYNGHTFAGKKVSLRSDSEIITATKTLTANGVPPEVENFFGTGYQIASGVIFNGVSNGNVSKAGDTVSGALSFTDGNPFYFYGSHDSLVSGHAQESFGLQRYRDKNGRQLGYSEFVLGADNSLLWQFLLFSPANSSKRSYIGCTVLADGTGYGVTRNPPTSDNTTSIATTYFVNQKLGSAASLAALATLDASDPNYVETLEIKKQKAVAQVNADAQAAIYGGFPYEIDGQDYIIGYSLFDQTNLNSDAVVAAGNPGKTMSFRCMDETGQTVWLDVPTETVLAIQKYGTVSHRDAVRKAADEKKARIMAAADETELQAIIAE